MKHFISNSLERFSYLHKLNYLKPLIRNFKNFQFSSHITNHQFTTSITQTTEYSNNNEEEEQEDLKIKKYQHSDMGRFHKPDTISLLDEDTKSKIYDMYVQPKLDYFSSQNFKINEFRLIIKKFPSILFLDIETQINPKIEYFKSFVTNPDQIRKALISSPTILQLDLEEEIIPKFDFLWHTIGMGNEKRASILELAPEFLLFKLEVLMRVCHFFSNRMASLKQIHEILTKFPLILDIPYPRIVQIYQYMISDKFEDDEFIRMAANCPRFLSYSLEKNIKPKIQVISIKC